MHIPALNARLVSLDDCTTEVLTTGNQGLGRLSWRHLLRNESRATIVATTYVIVVFLILVQGLSIKSLVEKANQTMPIEEKS